MLDRERLIGVPDSDRGFELRGRAEERTSFNEVEQLC